MWWVAVLEMPSLEDCNQYISELEKHWAATDYIDIIGKATALQWSMNGDLGMNNDLYWESSIITRPRVIETRHVVETYLLSLNDYIGDTYLFTNSPNSYNNTEDLKEHTVIHTKRKPIVCLYLCNLGNRANVSVELCIFWFVVRVMSSFHNLLVLVKRKRKTNKQTNKTK